jgi:16S rRNA A1518/A1519 N6-dimethyltransferase RsmA/KsgA/DIM1 with predicted DNA glycosylase/AP lyase activity
MGREGVRRYSTGLDTILGFDVMIETGAYLGTTTEMLAGLGRPVYSCELDHKFFLRAAVRLAGYNNVRLYNKDSRIFLKELLQRKSS